TSPGRHLRRGRRLAGDRSVRRRSAGGPGGVGAAERDTGTMPTSYLTVADVATAEVESKRSRFVCWLRRAESEDDARAVVDEARSSLWDARHHCSAFVIGPDAAVRRSSDDGEPSGTAGAPMLEVLARRGLSDVVAVVTRYFGGV